MVKQLRGYIGLTEASRITGLTLTRLQVMVDSGALSGLRDPVGRRLVWKPAVLKLAEKRGQAPTGAPLPKGSGRGG
jgi:hypothetical protein